MSDNVFEFTGGPKELEDLPLPEYFRQLAILAENDEIAAGACIVETVGGDINPVIVVDGDFARVTYLLCCMQTSIVETLQEELPEDYEE